jgi:hypothetical protein
MLLSRFPPADISSRASSHFWSSSFLLWRLLIHQARASSFIETVNFCVHLMNYLRCSGIHRRSSDKGHERLEWKNVSQNASQWRLDAGGCGEHLRMCLKATICRLRLSAIVASIKWEGRCCDRQVCHSFIPISIASVSSSCPTHNLSVKKADKLVEFDSFLSN